MNTEKAAYIDKDKEPDWSCYGNKVVLLWRRGGERLEARFFESTEEVFGYLNSDSNSTCGWSARGYKLGQGWSRIGKDEIIGIYRLTPVAEQNRLVLTERDEVVTKLVEETAHYFQWSLAKEPNNGEK